MTTGIIRVEKQPSKEPPLRFRIHPSVLLIVSSFFVSPVVATTIPPVSLTVSGDASPELLADFRQALERMAKRQPPRDGDGEPEAAGRIDTDQFWKVEQEVPYTVSQESTRQTLSITYPFEGESPYKVLVHFHGGDWQSDGHQSANHAAAYWAIYQGYALVDVGYRLAPEASWPAQLHDAKAAIRFLRANAGQFELDAERLVVMGSGAGAHLAQMLAATNGSAAAENPDMGFAGHSSAVQGVISWAGISDVTSLTTDLQPAVDELMGYPAYQSKLALEASPVAQVTAEFPPILLVHGTSDRVVPFAQSARMAIRVNAITGHPRAALRLVVNAGHQTRELVSQEVMMQSLDFADRILFADEGNPNRSLFYPGIQQVDGSAPGREPSNLD